MQKTLPKGWKMVRLGDVGQIITGNTPPKKEKKFYSNRYINFFKPDDFISDNVTVLHKSKDFLSEEGSMAARIVSSGAVLTTCIGTIGKVGIVEHNSSFNQQINAIVPDYSRVIPKYIAYAIYKRRKLLERFTNAPVVPIINKSQFSLFEIPLPPLPTQHKIVEILEEADNLRKLRQKADEKMKDLIPSLFVQMFGDPVTNPKGWEVKKLGEVCNKKTGMRDPTETQDGFFEYVDISSIDNISGKIISFRTIANIDAPSRARKIIKTNDVIVSTVRPNLNAVATVPNYLNNQICSTGFCVLRVYSDISNHHYVYAVTRSKYFIESMTKKTQGASYPAVSDKDIFNFLIPLPPLSLQQEFAKRIKEIEAEKARQSESKKKLDELFNSLMQRAFTGRLVA